MATQVTISKKQENKGAKGILDLTSTIGQVLKQFIGIYGKALPDCDGLTVEDWMDAHGVHRFVGKNGKKGNYTPALLMEGWHEGMKVCNDEGKVMQSCIFKNVPAKVLMDDPNNPDGVAYRVFTKEEAEKVDGKPISMYKLVGIEDNRWSVNTIIRGLKQTRNFDNENDKSVNSEVEWAEIEHVYIVKYVKVKNAQTGATEVLRKVQEVDKNRVTF
jgi:hypothetical protein